MKDGEKYKYQDEVRRACEIVVEIERQKTKLLFSRGRWRAAFWAMLVGWVLSLVVLYWASG